MMYIFLNLLLLTIISAQCNDWEVEIWELCYSIENTTVLHNSENTSGEFPIEICELVNLIISFCLS